MKKLSYMFMIALAAYAFQGCHNASKDAQQSADSSNKTTDTTSKMAATGSTKVNSADSSFATNAMEGGIAEVTLAKLALQKTTNEKIKNFANMMVTDHGKANTELAGIAKTKYMTLATGLSADDQKSADSLGTKSGKDFDKAYVKEMIAGHQGALKLFQDEAKNGTDPDLKAFAAKVAPTVQMHLDAINKIHDGMK